MQMDAGQPPAVGSYRGITLQRIPRLTTTPSPVFSTSIQRRASSMALSLSDARADPKHFSTTAGRTSARSLLGEGGRLETGINGH